MTRHYDNYAAQYKTLFVSGAGNGGATIRSIIRRQRCYNGIGVAAYGGGSSIGPTLDNGRAKPDITAPGTAETSFSTPYVAGAAAVLMQAGLRGDGGSDTNSAADIRTVKALLLNGAIKPADWTNGAASPLDARYGAGVLNVFNSYEQLAGQRQTNFVSASVSTGAAHPPTGATNTIGVLSGWNFTNLTSSSSSDEVNHYYFNVTNGVSNAAFTATATLVWNRQQNKSSINNLQLFLYNAANSNLVPSAPAPWTMSSTFMCRRCRRDVTICRCSRRAVLMSVPAKPMRLRLNFSPLPLSAARSGTNVILQWPVYPAGFVIQSTTNLAPPVVWNSLSNLVATVTNNQNYVVLNATNRNQFFRLQRP